MNLHDRSMHDPAPAVTTALRGGHGPTRILKVLVVHNLYQQSGGEDQVVASETRMLAAAGHEVVQLSRDNREIAGYSWWNKGLLGIRTLWSRDSARTMRQVLQQEKPDLAHLHNIVPLFSPSLYYACRDLNVPVVQTLHNYRLLCPSALLYREGAVCEKCLGKPLAWPGIMHGCYRQSHGASASIAGMVATHRALGTWKNAVDCYIVLSEFARHKLANSGIPADKIVVKPNYLDPDPGPKQELGNFALFVGRLSVEKGIYTLLHAWKRLSKPVPLTVVGDGPLAPAVKAASADMPYITWFGWANRSQVLATMKKARLLVLPSECYENFPITLAEAFSCGVPVIASAIGSLAELVEDRRTGLHFRASDSGDLAAKVEWAWTHPEETEDIGRRGRKQYETKYTAAANYSALLDVYDRVLRFKGASPTSK